MNILQSRVWNFSELRLILTSVCPMFVNSTFSLDSFMEQPTNTKNALKVHFIFLIIAAEIQTRHVFQRIDEDGRAGNLSAKNETKVSRVDQRCGDILGPFPAVTWKATQTPLFERPLSTKPSMPILYQLCDTHSRSILLYPCRRRLLRVISPLKFSVLRVVFLFISKSRGFKPGFFILLYSTSM